MELRVNLLLNHSLLHVVIVNITSLNEVVVLKDFSCHVSSVSWIVDAGLSMDHTVELGHSFLSLGLSGFKIFIKDVISLQVVGIVNQYFSSISWAEHSTVWGVNQSIELVNLNPILVSLEILIVPVISSCLDILPLGFNFSASSRVILFAVSGVDHTVKLTNLEDISLLSSLLLIVVSLEQFIVPLFVVHEVDILTMPLNEIDSGHGCSNWLSAKPLLVHLHIVVIEVNFLVGSWIVSLVSDMEESIILRWLWHIESVFLELRVVVIPVVVINITGLNVSLIPVD